MKLRSHILMLLAMVSVFGFSFHLRPSATCCNLPREPERQTPRLAVLIVFDQMRGDYLSRWQTLYFGKHGFERLLKDGAWYTNCHYPYADTVTAAGHASIATGCVPAEHRIVANEWRDRASGEENYCVAHGRYERVPTLRMVPAPPTRPTKGPKWNISPELLCAPTVGDAFKQATAGKSRVVSLSLKDRSAVLPAGQHPDACYWFDATSGQFVTSTYYRERVHPWVEAFNSGRPADAWFSRTWERLRSRLDYVPFSGPDLVPGEGKGFDQGRTFPHPMHGRSSAPNEKYYEAVFNSPFGNELLLELALAAIDAEQLGHGDSVDLLSISFSSNDAVGHTWGPDSQEVLDITLRSDEIMAQLLTHLDERVGKGGYVLLMTADHGICPLPEVARAHGQDAGRISPKILVQDAGAYLDEKFGVRTHKTSWFLPKPDLWLFFNHQFLKDVGLKAAEVASTLASWLKQQPGILTAYTHEQLLRGLALDDVIGAMVRRSFDAERSGDIALILKPNYLLTEPLATGTTHGSPHPYDTYVPLVVYGPGIRAGQHSERVSPLAAASILAQAAKLKRPAQAHTPAPEGLFLSP